MPEGGDPAPSAAVAEDRCSGCDRGLGWIDARHACPNGCLYCAECAAEAAGSCTACGEDLRRAAARARPLPRRDV